MVRKLIANAANGASRASRSQALAWERTALPALLARDEAEPHRQSVTRQSPGRTTQVILAQNVVHASRTSIQHLVCASSKNGLVWYGEGRAS